MSGVFHFDPTTGFYSNGLIDVEIKPVKTSRRKTDEGSGYVKVHGATMPHTDSASPVNGELVIRLDQSHTGGTMSSRYDFQSLCEALDRQCNGARNDGETSSNLQVEPKTIEDIALSHFNYSRMDEQREITPDELNRLALQARQSQRIQGNYTQAHKHRQSLNGRQTRFYRPNSMLG